MILAFDSVASVGFLMGFLNDQLVQVDSFCSHSINNLDNLFFIFFFDFVVVGKHIKQMRVAFFSLFQ